MALVPTSSRWTPFRWFNRRSADGPCRTRSVASRPRVELLENRTLLSLDLLGQWNGGTPQYSDGWVVDNLAFLVHFEQQEGVHVIDVSDPTNPVEISRFVSPDTTNDYRDVEVQWQLVNDEWRLIGYLSGDGPNSAQRQNGVVIVDFSDPYNPVQLFKITAAHGGTNTVHTVCVRGDYLFEADSRTAAIRVFNVSNPSNPRWVRNISSSLEDPVHEVTEQWGRLYAANIFGQYSVDIFDVSQLGEPGNPVTHLGRVSGDTIGPWPHTAWPTDDGLYMATTREASGGTLAFWDISDPSTPQMLWEIGRPTSETCCVHQVMIRGNYLYASWYAAGLYVYDISDPYNPIEIGGYDTYPGGGDIRTGAWGIFGNWYDSRVFGFDRHSGLFIFQLNPDGAPGPGRVGQFEGSGSQAVRGRWAVGRGVESFLPEQIARVTGTTLTLTLGAGDDTEVVSRNREGGTIDVTINGTLRFRYEANLLRQLNVRALEGNDRIVLDPNLGLELFLDGGPGDDLVEGWRDDYLNPPVIHVGNVHSPPRVPYQAIAVEQFLHVRSGAGSARLLDNHAHQMIQHAASVARSGTGMLAGLAGHAETAWPIAEGNTSATSGVHAVAAAGSSSHVWGVPKQVVWHKPG